MKRQKPTAQEDAIMHITGVKKIRRSQEEIAAELQTRLDKIALRSAHAKADAAFDLMIESLDESAREEHSITAEQPILDYIELRRAVLALEAKIAGAKS